MRSFLKIKIFLFVISFTCVNVNAAVQELDFNIDQVNSISITNQLTESFVGENGLDGVPFFRLLVNNNNFNGYDISISSSNSGQLRIDSGYDSTKNGTFINYTNIWEPNNEDTFFKYDCSSGVPVDTSTETNSTVYVNDILVTSYEQSYFSLNSSIEYNFVNPYEATVNCKAYALLIANADTTVFAGTFSDTITVSISNR